jgi:hypothetical protein
MSVVGVPMLSRYLIQSSPAVSLVHSLSSLCGLTSQVKLPYVTSFRLSHGTLSFLMNLIVSVPFTLPPTPCARHPNTFAVDFDWIVLCLGSCIDSW